MLTLGSILKGIREHRALSMLDTGKATGIDEHRIAKLERDGVVCNRKDIDAYKRAFTLTESEKEQIERLFVPRGRDCDHIACSNCADHDGEMRTGGPLGARDEHCSGCDDCLNTFIRRWATAPRSHCPPNYTKRVHEEREQIISIGSTLHARR